MLAKVIQGLLNLVAIVVNFVVGILPDTPFKWQFDWLGPLRPYWNFVNYFIPFGAMISVTMAYIAAVAVWYVVRWLLRFVRYIQ